MTGVLLAILGAAVAGLGLARLLHPSARPVVLAGEAFLLGIGWLHLALLGASLAGLRWSATLVAIAVILPAALLLVRRPSPGVRTAAPETPLCRLIDAITVLTASGYAVFATIAPMWEWDFWAIWGLKARVFFERGGVDWDFLRRTENLFTNPDYPLLLPLSYDLVAITSGGWEERWIGLLFPLFGVSLLLIARGMLEEDLRSSCAASAATLALTAFAFTSWIGLAEGPLIAFAGAGLILIRQGLLREDAESWRTGAVLLGFAALTKNEGAALVVAAAAAALVHLGRRWRDAARLWPAVAIGGIWPLLRVLLHLRSYYLSSGTVPERLLARLQSPGELVSALVEFHASHALFWLAFAVVLLVSLRRLSRERFLLVAIAAQVFFYVLAYAATSHPLRWQVQFSWPRLVDQLGFPAMFLAIVVLFPIIRGRAWKQDS